MFGQILFPLILQKDPLYYFYLELIVLGLIASYIGISFIISVLYSLLGPWQKLACVYQTECEFDGLSFYPRVWIGKFIYSGLLKVHLTTNGICLSMLPWCKIGHPQLFIPWTDISLEKIENELDFLGVSLHEWKIGKPEITSITFSSKSLNRRKKYIPKSLLMF